MNILIVFEIPFKYWHKVVWEEIGNITRLSLEQSVLRGPSLCQVAGGTRDAKSWMHSQLSFVVHGFHMRRIVQYKEGMGCIFISNIVSDGKAWLWRKNRPDFIGMDRIITVWVLPNSPLPWGCTHCTPGIIQEWLRTTSQHNIYTSTHWGDLRLRLSRWPPWAK